MRLIFTSIYLYMRLKIYLSFPNAPGLTRCFASGRRRAGSWGGPLAAALPDSGSLAGLCVGLTSGLLPCGALLAGPVGLAGGLSPLSRPVCSPEGSLHGTGAAPPNSATPPTGPAERLLADEPSCCSMEAASADRLPDTGRAPPPLRRATSGESGVSAAGGGSTESGRESMTVAAAGGTGFGSAEMFFVWSTFSSNGAVLTALLGVFWAAIPSPGARLATFAAAPAESADLAAVPTLAAEAGWNRSSSSLSESNRLADTAFR